MHKFIFRWIVVISFLPTLVWAQDQPSLSKTEKPSSLLEKKRSRFGLVADIAPGVYIEPSSSGPLSPEGVYAALYSSIGASFYVLDRCQVSKAGQCVDLIVSLSFHTRAYFITKEQSPYSVVSIGASLDIEPQIFFGSQRSVAWVIRARVGYYHYVDTQPGNTFASGIGGLVGTGAAFFIPHTGLSFFIQADVMVNPLSFSQLVFVPIGFRYRF